MSPLLAFLEPLLPIADAPAAPAGDPLTALLGELLAAIVHGDWWVAAALACTALGTAVRLFGPRLHPLLGHLGWNLAATFAIALLGGLCNALGAGAELGLEVLTAALRIGFSAVVASGLLHLAIKRLTPPPPVIGSSVPPSSGTGAAGAP